MERQNVRSSAVTNDQIQGAPAHEVPHKVMIVPVRGKGLGVVARETINAGEIIETCPMLLQPDTVPAASALTDPAGLHRFDNLEDYFFAWGSGCCALAFGLGGLYNHSDQPNACTVKHLAAARMTIQALRTILPGQEITIRYQQVWFHSLD